VKGMSNKQTQEVLKWFGLISAILGGIWTIGTYFAARTKEQNAYVFQQQTAFYLDAVQSAATLAVALDPASKDKEAIDPQTLKAARQKFEQLYWGDMVVVEDRRVEIAMVRLRDCLLKNGNDCSRAATDQDGKPISQEVLSKLKEPIMLNLALELAACARSALQTDRDIKFGAKEIALTVCPYDSRPFWATRIWH
jgi:hypothetical protein